MNLQLGVYSFGNTPRTADGSYGPTAQAIRNVLEAVHLTGREERGFYAALFSPLTKPSRQLG
jgi:hypothetical protein